MLTNKPNTTIINHDMKKKVLQKKYIQQSVTFESESQKQKIKRAAEIKKWSTSQFILEAANKAADELLALEQQQSVA